MSSGIEQYLHVEPYQEVLSGIAFVLSVSGGVVKLTGTSGAGKSALCREICKELRQEKTEFVSFETAPASVEDFRRQIEQKLRLDKKQAFTEALTRHIIKKPFDQQKLVLVLDTAEELSEGILLELTALRSIELNEQGLVSILLSGSEGLDKILVQPEYQKLLDDLVVSYKLEPMKRAELSAFCEAYLTSMKLDAESLGRDKLDELLRLSSGYPGEALDLLPDLLDQDSSRKLLKKIRQKELVNKATQTLTHEFVDPLRDHEMQAQVISRWKGPLGKTVVVAGVAVGLFLAYATYIFIPDTLIPAGVSYFGSDVDEVVPVAQVLPASPVADVVSPAPVAEAPATVTEAPTLAETPVAAVPAPEAVAETLPVVEALPAVEAIAEADSLPAGPAPAPAVSQPRDMLAAVQDRIENWLSVWEAQDTDAYFAQYHENFSPPAPLSVDAWRNQRSRNISRPAAIAIEMQDFTILELDAGEAVVSFWMRYDSPNYADRTLKEIRLGPDSDGEWRILAEENRQLERLTAGSQAAPRLEVMLTAPTLSSQQDINVIPVTPAQINPALDVQERALFNFANDWLASWQRQDVAAYFGFYTEGYRHPEFSSATAWQSDRRLKINRPSYIELRMHEFEVLRHSGNEALVRMDVEYRTPSYADRTSKELLIARQAGGQFVIRLERNLRVTSLPVYRRPEPRFADLAASP